MSEARHTGAGVTDGCTVLALYWGVGNPTPSSVLSHLSSP